VSRYDDQPKRLGDLLGDVAKRLRKVDLSLIDEVRAMWPNVVDPALAEHCQPEFVKNGVLVIRVPSGAYAQRVHEEHALILAGYSSLGAKAPTSLRTVLAGP
jgi:predicted nucleic acid-binding Zn ribbon protein